MKKFLSVVLITALVLCGSCVSFAQDDSAITILCTNDVHCTYTDYDKIAALAKDADLLIDNGDAVQGDLVGTLSKGEYIIDIMNYLGYDLAGLGNHEFDYGIERLKYLTDKADYPYICCNFKSLETGKLLCEPYRIFDIKGKRIAIVAADTPETLASANPKFFKNSDDELIYSFAERNNGMELVETIQKYVDEVRREGADIVLLLSHLGIDEFDYTRPWSSTHVIAHTEGIDVVLDGHSHSVTDMSLPNKNGENVRLLQTGTALAYCTKVEISGDDITCSLIDLSEAERDPAATAFIATISEKFEAIRQEKVAVALQPLNMYDENDKRLVRNNTAALADFCADALCWKTGAEIGLLNGGGIRASIAQGDVTVGNLISVHSFANTVVEAKVSGQMLADILEQAASTLPAEYGGFIHASGIEWSIDTDIPSPVRTNESGEMVAIEGTRRVHDITVGGEPLDLQRKYTVAGSEYVVLGGGNGLPAVPEKDVINPNCGIDYEILIEYARDALHGIIGEQYAQPAGRIRFEAAEEPAAAQEAPILPLNSAAYTVQKGDCLWTIARRQLGDPKAWMTIYQLNRDIIRDPKLIYPGQVLKLAK